MPLFQANLADRIEIELVDCVERFHDFRTFPAGIAESLAKDRLLRIRIVVLDHRLDRCLKDQEEDRLPIAEGKARDFPSRYAVADVGALIAMRIAVYGECSGAVPQVALPAGRRPEYQPAHGRMKAIGADDEIEPSG